MTIDHKSQICSQYCSRLLTIQSSSTQNSPVSLLQSLLIVNVDQWRQFCSPSFSLHTCIHYIHLWSIWYTFRCIYIYIHIIYIYTHYTYIQLYTYVWLCMILYVYSTYPLFLWYFASCLPTGSQVCWSQPHPPCSGSYLLRLHSCLYHPCIRWEGFGDSHQTWVVSLLSLATAG